MKATDLMIGDYVRHKKTKDIIGIFEIDDDRKVINNEPDGYCSERNILLDEIEPILLSPEILEKNGWYIPDLCLWYRHNSVPFLISKRGGNLFCLYADSEHDKREFFCTINYVHELQHALRLCGIKKEIIL